MPAAYSVEQIRSLEAAAMSALPPGALMQRAAAGLAQTAVRVLARKRPEFASLRTILRKSAVYGARVLILAGVGDNGGDALFAGERLARRGARVTAVRVFGRVHPEGLAALLAVGGRVVDLDDVDLGAVDLGELDLVIDGILGIGGRPGLPSAVSALVGRVRDARVPILAVDLPSGVDTDTGVAPDSAVQADWTVTFGALKACHLIEPARGRCGVIELVDIGLDTAGVGAELIMRTADDLVAGWPFPGVHSDKYARGVVGIDAGSNTYPGAGILATHGAVYAGAGMVRFLGPEVAGDVIRAELPNVIFEPGRVQAMLLGSGWGERPDGEEVIAEVVERGIPAVIDADGLRYLPEDLPDTCLLTPHAGELARLLDCERSEVEADPAQAARAGADQTGATVLLKGATQFVAVPDARVVEIAVPGPSWTAQAGSGDVLAGICVTVLAAGRTAAQAAILGASLQAITAEKYPGSLPPQELVKRSALVLGALRASQGTVRGQGTARGQEVEGR